MSTTLGSGPPTAAGAKTRVVAVAVAPLHAEPRAGSEQVSQRVAGHRVEVLEDRTPWLRVRGEDGYEGWTHAGYLIGSAEAARAAGADEERISLGCVARTLDRRRAVYPLGARVAGIAYLEAGEAIPPTELPRRFPLEADVVAQTALTFFEGTPYQWGGVTPWGADCSGMVQTCFALHGVMLPRDAWQQAKQGRDAGSDIGTLQPADLLFFTDRADGRPTHVGIALGQSRMAHSALGRGGFAIDKLSEPADAYTAQLVERFRFARRVL